MNEIFRMGLALIIVVFMNCLFGSMSAILDGTFDPIVARKGLLKGFIMIIACFGIYGAGTLVPDLMVITLNGVELSLLTALEVAFKSGIVYYGALDVQKIFSLLGIKVGENLGPKSHEV